MSTSTIARSARADVRNPLLSIPEILAEASKLSAAERQSLERILLGMSRVFRAKGDTAWKQHKAPMAAYWKVNAVNARHIALALRRTGCQ